MVLSALNVPVTSIIALLSVAGLAVSLALQNTLSNLASGIVIMVSKPFVVGDYVEIDNVGGTVSTVGLVYSMLVTVENKEIYIPNSQLSSATIINYTHLGHRRMELLFSASYDAPTETVKTALREVVEQFPQILSDPAPAIWLNAYKDSCIEYVVRVWTTTEDYWNASSGLNRFGTTGNHRQHHHAAAATTFSADGRCVSLLKVLLTNVCAYDCQYCVNRRSNDVPRAAFTPRELAELTMGFYRRNYIEGLFLSSAVLRDPDYTTELMIASLRLLREEYRFGGYIHAKAIPGADPLLTRRLGLLADRMSVNIELPSAKSLSLLAPDKKRRPSWPP